MVSVSQHQAVRRLVYTSVAAGSDYKADHAAILQSARVNNALDGVTGMLWGNGQEFIQVMEGAESAVAEVFAKIRLDPRHRDIVILSDQSGVERAFAYWTMATVDSGEDLPKVRAQLARFLQNAPEHVRLAFLDRHIGV